MVGFLNRLRRLNGTLLILLVVMGSAPLTDPVGERLNRLIPAGGCAAMPANIDHGGVIEELHHAYEWNKLLADSRLAAIDHTYFSTEAVLDRVDSWTPLIACVAREFDIPPELLAGILACELDLDYHAADAVVDGLIRTPWGASLANIEMGAGYAGIHVGHLRPALATFGGHFSSSPFYRLYYHTIMTRSNADLTLLSTRYTLVDIADAAVMARYYVGLRLGTRPMSSLTIDDMAFIWSAYRGGVLGTPADPRPDSRWSLDYLQKADNPHVFGDTIIALPYFSYYRQVYRSLGFTP